MKNLTRKLGLALAAFAAVIGLTLGASVPAEAVNLSRVQHCNWPQKATITVAGAQGYKVTLRAYSPTGWLLGTYVGYGAFTWNTPWEDISVFSNTSDSSWTLGGYCRW